MHCKCIGYLKQGVRMKFLRKYNTLIGSIGSITMMQKIRLDHLVRNVACTPDAITYSPEMSPPVLTTNLRKLFLKSTRRLTLQASYQITNGYRRCILNMKMHMIFAYNATQNLYVFCITYLLEQVPASYLKIPLKYMVTILRRPDNMRCEP